VEQRPDDRQAQCGGGGGGGEQRTALGTPRGRRQLRLAGRWHRTGRIGARGGRSTQREKTDSTAPEQCQRVDVHRTAQQPPVQASRPWAPRVAGGKPAERLASGHDLAGSYRRGQRLVGGAQAARVADGDHPAPRQHAGPADYAPAGRRYAGPGDRAEVDPSVPGTVRGLGRLEGPDHVRAPGERPLPAALGRGG